MSYATRSDSIRLSVLIPRATKDRLTEISSANKTRLSTFVRESIDEKISRMEQEVFEERMRLAYQDMAEENLSLCKEFKHVDAEHLGK